jgi:hypothetical protein
MSKLTNYLVDKLGSDKLLHFAFGGYITTCINNILTPINLGWWMLLIYLIGPILVLVLSEIKEHKLDQEVDHRDTLFAMLGSLGIYLTYIISLL